VARRDKTLGVAGEYLRSSRERKRWIFSTKKPTHPPARPPFPSMLFNLPVVEAFGWESIYFSFVSGGDQHSCFFCTPPTLPTCELSALSFYYCCIVHLLTVRK
jgi:hypothetical protein